MKVVKHFNFIVAVLCGLYCSSVFAAISQTAVFYGIAVYISNLFDDVEQ